SIRITCEIDERCQSRRLFGQALDRHDREYLPDRPVVESGLENGKITQILVDEPFPHCDEVLGKQLRISSLKHPVDRDANRPVQFLGHRLLIESEISEFKQ